MNRLRHGLLRGLWLCCFVVAAGAQLIGWGQETPEATFRGELRVVWGGSALRSFAGTLAIDAGVLKPVRNLSMQADSIGRIQSENSQSIRVEPHSPSLFGGVDIAVEGRLSSRLSLRFENPFTEQTTEFEVRLGDLLQGSWVQQLDDRGNRIAIERQAHDRLRVQSSDTQPIFERGEAWPIAVAGYRTGLPAGQYTLNVLFSRDSIASGDSSQQVVSLDADGSFAPLKFELHAPEEAGAYQLEIALQRRNFLNSFVTTGPTLIRRLDLVVVDSQQAPPRIAGWESLATINALRASRPSNLAWLTAFDMRKPLAMVPGGEMAAHSLTGMVGPTLSHGHLGARTLEGTASTDESAASQDCLALGPEAWVAYPINGLTPHHPHRLRVRVPADRAMDLAVSLQQPSAAGEVPPLSLDSGLSIGARQTSLPGGLAEHEIVFWPRAEQVQVVLVNTSEVDVATVLELELERAELQAVPAASSSVDAPSGVAQGRMLGLYLDQPLLADGLSANRQRDPMTGRSLESWDTWHQSAIRISQLMQIRHANTLLLKGLADGGAIFPSEKLQPTRRFDSGAFFSDSRSPEIKDAIELLLQHFDRDGRHLILALDLNTHLPGLARLENEPGQTSIWQQPLGKSPVNAKSEGPAERRYNPLNPRVQEEIVAVVREISGRYGDHPAFAGIAIQLDQASQLAFAGDRWGYDAETLEAFQQATKLKLPPAEQLEAVFNGPARLAFLDWRAKELTKLYQRLGDTVQRARPDAKLYLNVVRLWDDFPQESDFYDPKAIIRNPREYLLAFGISPEALAAVPQVELMRGAFDSVSDSVNSQDWIRRESGQRGMVEFHADSDRAAVVLRYPRPYALAESEKLGAAAPAWIYPTLFAPGDHVRQKLVQQIFAADPVILIDGGWLSFCRVDASLRALYQTLAELPPVKLALVPLSQPESNVRLRLGKHEGKCYLQMVNTAAWSESVTIEYQTQGPKPKIRILGERQLDLAADENASGNARAMRWSLVLRPYDVVAIEIADPDFRIQNVRHTPQLDALQQLTREINTLDALVSQAADPTQQKLLANVEGDFERWTENGAPLGWNISSLPQVQIGRSLDLPHTGRSSLLIENRSQNSTSAWVQSRGFQPPTTGRMTVQAWLRAPAASQSLQVRLSVVGRTQSGQRFERSMQLGTRGEAGQEIPIDWGRKPVSLSVGEIPTELLNELYVSIELIGPGKVWVDDVQVFEAYLQPTERIHLRGQLLVAKQKLAENNPYPAEQLLDSHWGQYLMRFGSSQATTQLAGREAQPAAEVSSPSSSGSQWDESPSLFRQLRESVRDRWRR